MVTTFIEPKDEIVHWRIDVERYHRMISSGVLTENDDLELLNGWLVEKMVISPAHAAATNKLLKALNNKDLVGVYISCQTPITLEESEPEPDICIVRGDLETFEQAHPTASDIELVVEVAESSLPVDSGLKKRLYAQAGIAFYWIVNLVEQHIEVYSDPLDQDYGTANTFKYGQTIFARVADQDLTFAVDDVLPKA
jgi:Uma2 family endonuclease